jgi:hypothetical protein
MATEPCGSDWSTKRRTRKASFVNTWTGRLVHWNAATIRRNTQRDGGQFPASVRKEKRRVSPKANVEKEIATLTTVAASVRGGDGKI